MSDVSDIVRDRSELSFVKAPRQYPNRIANVAHDMFQCPSIVGMADAKLKMFSYTMKKRKFPFETADSSSKAAEEQEIENTRRMSGLSASSFGHDSLLSRDESFAAETIDEDKPFQLADADVYVVATYWYHGLRWC